MFLSCDRTGSTGDRHLLPSFRRDSIRQAQHPQRLVPRSKIFLPGLSNAVPVRRVRRPFDDHHRSSSRWETRRPDGTVGVGRDRGGHPPLSTSRITQYEWGRRFRDALRTLDGHVPRRLHGHVRWRRVGKHVLPYGSTSTPRDRLYRTRQS